MIKLKRAIFVIYLSAIFVINLGLLMPLEKFYQRPIGPNKVEVFFADEKSDKRYVHYIMDKEEHIKNIGKKGEDKTMEGNIGVEVWILTSYLEGPMKGLAFFNWISTGCFIAVSLVIRRFERKT